MRRHFFILPLISALFLTFASCSDIFYSDNGYCWGTSYHIVYKSDKKLTDSIIAEIDRIDASLSMFNDSSVVSAVNDSRSDSVDALFADVFRLSQRVSALSGGAFDPTVGPLVELWGFGRKRSDSIGTPDSAAIADALGTVGIAACRLCDGDRRIVRKSDRTRFDFSAIAKGYGVDRVAAMLRRNGVEDYMVEIGGEIALRGHNSRGQRWRIQIDAPVDAESSGELHSRYAVVALGPEACAVAGSGNYRNRRRASDGSLIGHTISAVTGRPVVGSGTLASTVIAPTCALADALATAAMAMPADSALAMADRLAAEGVAMLLICDGGNDSTFTELASRNFPSDAALSRK